jgi:hypothetical protein
MAGFVRFALFMTMLCNLCGCSGDSLLPCYEVAGTITIKGQPVKGLRVWLVPADETLAKANPPVRPYAECDEKGSFTSTTYTKHDGAPVGQYALFLEAAPGMTGGGEDDPTPPTLGKASTIRLPVKYQNPKTSGLSVTVKAEKNVVTHDLK